MNSHLLPGGKCIHGGKWSQEEELYAAALIEAFKAGVLPADDIDEGTSLRKYLAKKLMCSPKRVSKKYEGTNYNGKQVYFKNRGVSGTLLSPQEQLALLAKIQLLEHKFLQSLAENKTPGGLVSQQQQQQASSELDMYTQLQMQALAKDQQQLTFGSSLYSAVAAQRQHRTSLVAAAPRPSLMAQVPSLAQTLALSKLQEQSLQAGIEGTILDRLGGPPFASTSPSSLMPQIQLDNQERARMALAGGNQLALPSGGLSASGLAAGLPLSNNSQLLSQAAARRSSMIDATVEAARIQQLEQSLLQNQAHAQVGTNPLVRNTSTSLQASLHGAARGRSASLVEQQQQSLLEASILESYLREKNLSSAASLPASAAAAAAAQLDTSALGQPLQQPPNLSAFAQRTSQQLLASSNANDSTDEKKRPSQQSGLGEGGPKEPPAKRWKPY